MSKRKSGLDVNGIILLDKRSGVSSNKALQEVRRLFNANKAGHTGSLDPLATGLLPLCFGKATKVSALLLDHDKRYEVLIKLGVVTDTGDLEGKVLAEHPVPDLDLARIQECLMHFTGAYAQVPPMYSALKYQGKKLYELARAGITVEREPRTISVYELKLLELGENWLSLSVFCSKGTYIRSLAMDIGEYLGCGATVTQLRRIEVGQFKLSDAHSIDQLQQMLPDKLQNCLISADVPLQFMPAIALTDWQASCIKFGQAIEINDQPLGMVRLYAQEIFLGLGELLINGKLVPRKLFY